MALEAWYPLHRDLEDYSGNGNHLTGAPTFIEDGVIGQALSPDGGQAIAPLNDNLKRVFNSADMTMTFWVRNNPGTQDWADIISFEDAYGITRRYERNTVNTSANSDFWVNIGRNDPVYTSSIAASSNMTGIPEGTWYHVAIRRTPTQFDMFVNGAVFRTAVPDFPEPTGISSNLRLMHSTVCASDLCDVRLFSHALSNREIAEIAKAKFLHWSIDSESVFDRSGYRHNGAMATGANPVEFRTDSIHGSISPYLPNTTKAGIYSQFQSTVTVHIPTQGTMAVWVKAVPSEQNADNLYPFGWEKFCAMADLADGTQRIGFRFHEDDPNTLPDSYVLKSVTGVSMITSEWVHIAIGWDDISKTLSMWRDGELVYDGPYTQAMYHINTRRTFYLGVGWTTGYGGITGLMDDMRCYARKLSTEDVDHIVKSKARLSNLGELTVAEVKENHLELDDGSYPVYKEGNWVRIYHHVVDIDAPGEQFFDDDAEAAFANSDNPYARKYSILSKMESFRMEDGRFRFKLRYPQFSQELLWYQTSDPTVTSNSVTGYEAIDIDSDLGSKDWGGLSKALSGATYLDGNPGISNWHYAIGSNVIWSGGIPADERPAHDVELFVWLPAEPGKVTRQGQLLTSEVSTMGVTDGLAGYWKLDGRTRESTRSLANVNEANVQWDEGAFKVDANTFIRTGISGIQALANSTGFTLMCMGKAKFDNTDIVAGTTHGVVFGRYGYNWGILKKNDTEEWYSTVWADTDSDGSPNAGVSTTPTASTGDWDFLCMVYDPINNVHSMTVNETTISRTVSTYPIILTGDWLAVGSGSSAWGTKTLVKEARYYDRPLTPAEVESMRKLLSGNEKMQIHRDGTVYVPEVNEG